MLSYHKCHTLDVVHLINGVLSVAALVFATLFLVDIFGLIAYNTVNYLLKDDDLI